ncbi:MAG TPA: glycosyltransferase family 4 protein [Terriglobia bacterium]|nr:glycosyltransferase family 4 protein [Terriglobia bacterium]
MSRVCMVVFSEYPKDPRVRREAEALVEAGIPVDVICLRGKGVPQEVVDGVRVFRLPLQQTRAGKARYAWEYCAFIVMALIKVGLLHLKERYRLVHVHNMPNILILTALLPRLSGAKVLLDLHDPMPEVYMAKYSGRDGSKALRLLRLEERLSIRWADFVLTPNIAFRELFISRGCPESKIDIVMNSPQEKVFVQARESTPVAQESAERFVVMCHGSISERNGLGTALEALSLVRSEIPNLVFEVFGGGDFVEGFLKRVEDLGLQDIVNYHGGVRLEEIARAITRINVGIVPNGSSKFSSLNMPTRIFEYLCMERPVITARTRGVLDYFDDASLHMFEPGDSESLARAILDVFRNRERSRMVLARGIAVYRSHRWELEKARLVRIVKNVMGDDGARTEREKLKVGVAAK